MSIYTYKNLYRAYLDCREHKRKTVNALKFEINLENNLKQLLEELRSGAYQPGRSICFVVTEPCPREIFAADFRDRVVHHLFVRELIDKAEQMFIYDSYACRVGKGTHKAVERLAEFILRIRKHSLCHSGMKRSGMEAKCPLGESLKHCYRTTQDRCAEQVEGIPPLRCGMTKEKYCDVARKANKAYSWYMKLDIKSFFMSINKDILYDLTLELIDKHKRSDAWKNEMSDLAGKIIFHCPQNNYVRKGDPALKELVPPHKSLLSQPKHKGLPIGNYSSQFFANLYMNKIDHYAKRILKCRHYIRYVDDIIILGSNRDLKEWRDKISIKIKEKLGIQLNIKKTIIQPLDKGIDFLGYFIKNNRIYPRRSVTARYKNKLYGAALGINKMPFMELRSIAASYEGHCGCFN